MAEVIGSAAYQLILDSTKFEKGAKLTRQESQALRRTLRDIETPAEKHQKKLDQLASLYRKGKLSAEQLRLGIDKLEKEYEQLTDAQNKSAKSGKNVSASAKSIGIAVTATTMIVQKAEQAFRAMIAEAQNMDKIAKSARKLGVATDELVSLGYAAERLSGLTSGQFATAFQRMTRRIAEAAQGTGEARKAIQELGLDAEELARDPANAFLQIADAIRSVGNDSDKLRLAFKLFDSEGAGLVTTLDAGSASIERLQVKAGQLGLTFSDETAGGIESANDAVADLGAALQGLYRQSLAGIAPKLLKDLDTMNGIISQISGGAATMQDTVEFMMSAQNPFNPIAQVMPMVELLEGGMAEQGREYDEQMDRITQQRRDADAQAEAERGREAADAEALRKMDEEAERRFNERREAYLQEQEKAREEEQKRYTEMSRKAKDSREKAREEEWTQFEKQLEKQADAEEKAEERRRQQWEKIGMGGVEQGSAEAFRLRREMNKKDEVQTVRLVPEQEDLLKTEVDVGVPIATGGIDINGVV